MIQFRVQGAEISEEQGEFRRPLRREGRLGCRGGGLRSTSVGRGVENNRELQPASRRGGLGSCEMMYQDPMTRTAKSKL